MENMNHKSKNHSGYYYLKYTVDMFRNGFNFKGRTNRVCYWIQVLEWISLLLIVGGIAAFIIGVVLPEGAAQVATTVLFSLFMFVELIVLIPRIAMAVRRNHDFDISGWWLVLVLLPYIGCGVVVFGFMAGTPGENRFGLAPGDDNLSTSGVTEAEAVIVT